MGWGMGIKFSVVCPDTADVLDAQLHARTFSMGMRSVQKGLLSPLILRDSKMTRASTPSPSTNTADLICPVSP